MIQKPYKESTIIWQEDPEDGVAEKPIVVEEYHDVILLSQNGESINLNFHTIPEFIKVLKQCQKK